MILRNPGWLDGVVISGGEPTLHTGLPLLIRHFRELGLPVKINTNGTDPEMLQRLMREQLIEAVAMDVKAPLDERYERCAGVHVDLDAITESIEMIIASDIAYEFCTTVCPPLLSEQDVIDTAKDLRGAKRFVLQKFSPRNCIDSSLLQVQPYTPEAMRALAAQSQKYVQRCVVRGDYAEDKKPAVQ
jgi:pyruvate formate lyase activating enzyme